MIVRLLSLSAALVLAFPAAAAEKATFIEGIYAMEGNCEAWAATQMDDSGAAGPGAVEILTEDGFKTLEGGCTFVRIEEKAKGRRWVARMNCTGDAGEGEETDTFELDPASGHITVTVDDNKSDFVRCDAAKGN
jgi:hypothetical protein